MTAFLSAELELTRLEDALTLPCPKLAETVVLGLLNLLAGRPERDRASAAAARLRRYAGLENGTAPLARQAEALIRSRLGRRGLLAPWRETLVRDLRGAPALLAELPGLLAEHRITSYGGVVDLLLRQLAAYHDFLRQEVLPRCRDDFRLPGELYAAKLRRCGVEMPIEELSHRAESAFGDLRRQLDETSRRLARRRAWQEARFPEILKRLLRDRLEPGEMLDHYARRHRQLDQLVADTGFATLPRGRRYRVRLASDAETAVIPFPYFRWPRIFAGGGEAGEIVLPLTSSGNVYASRATSWAVAVHEGFPGHALQTARLLEPDVPLARGPLAFNDAAQEGWAVYAEAELSPYLPLEPRCLTLLSQLRRAAGAFLDPGGPAAGPLHAPAGRSPAARRRRARRQRNRTARMAIHRVVARPGDDVLLRSHPTGGAAHCGRVPARPGVRSPAVPRRAAGPGSAAALAAAPVDAGAVRGGATSGCMKVVSSSSPASPRHVVTGSL